MHDVVHMYGLGDGETRMKPTQGYAFDLNLFITHRHYDLNTFTTEQT